MESIILGVTTSIGGFLFGYDTVRPRTIRLPAFRDSD